MNTIELPFTYGKNEIPLKQFQNININNFVRNRNPGRKKRRPSPLKIEPEPVPSRNVKLLPKHLIGRFNGDKNKSKAKVYYWFDKLILIRNMNKVLEI